jgi:hypothetical protein
MQRIALNVFLGWIVVPRLPTRAFSAACRAAWSEAHVTGQEAHQGEDHSEHGKDASGDHSHHRVIPRVSGVSITPMG